MKGEFNFEVRDMHLLRWEGSAQQADLLYGLFVPPDRLTCFGPLRGLSFGPLKSNRSLIIALFCNLSFVPPNKPPLKPCILFS